MIITFKLLLSLNYVASEDSMTQAKLNQTSAKYLTHNSHFCLQPLYFRRNGHTICSTEVGNFVKS